MLPTLTLLEIRHCSLNLLQRSKRSRGRAIAGWFVFLILDILKH